MQELEANVQVVCTNFASMQKLRAHDSLETFVGSAATNGSARLRKISYCTMPVRLVVQYTSRA